ncbi:MAG: hypothetical protein ACI81W_000160, partial [Saprospiraceae bacterium]
PGRKSHNGRKIRSKPKIPDILVPLTSHSLAIARRV